eukprot:14074560-Ditylum_brightwellii.AAC.1
MELVVVAMSKRCQVISCRFTENMWRAVEICILYGFRNVPAKSDAFRRKMGAIGIAGTMTIMARMT